jgi:hypothetical protein
MLIALLSAWLLGGGPGSSANSGYVDLVEHYATTQIEEKPRRQAVLATARKLESAGREEAKAADKAASALVKIAENRQAPPQEYEAVLSRIRGYSIHLQDELVKQRFRLKSELTREQWAALHAQSSPPASS